MSAEFDHSRSPFFGRVHDYLRHRRSKDGRSALVDECIGLLCEGKSLSEEQSHQLFNQIIHGELSDDQVGSVLVLLLPEQMSASSIAAFARVLLDNCPNVIDPGLEPGEILGDTCGTGLDALGTFNVSTTIMFVLAASGIKIAKHGNRAITSRCGSADVLERLGVIISLDAMAVERCIREIGIGFLFAPEFHRAMRGVQRIRHLLAKEMPENLKARTVFNVLGPLANPARVQCQIIGVYDRSLVVKIAEALRLLGVRRAIVAHGSCDGSDRGLDEFSTAGETYFAELHDQAIAEGTITPEEVGLPRARGASEFAGGDVDTNAAILTDILANREVGPRMDLALMNAGAGLYVAEKARTIGEGVETARAIIRGQTALEKLEQLKRKTNELRP